MTRLPVPDLGAYLREQRVAAELSLRQLAERAGVSNPYLSQIERGLRKPSAEILGALADALDLSAEALYVRAGILSAAITPGVPAAVAADPALTEPQRKALLDLYALFVDDADARPVAAAPAVEAGSDAEPAQPATPAGPPANPERPADPEDHTHPTGTATVRAIHRKEIA